MTAVAFRSEPRRALTLRVRGVATTTDSSEGGGVVPAALHYLEGKKRLVDCLSPAEYAAVDSSIGASVGGHVRHTLDHFSKCLAAARPMSDGTSSAPVTIRYDYRVRGGSIEQDPAAASRLIDSLLQQLRALPRGCALRAARLTPTFMLMSPSEGDGEEHEFASNLERELFFCCHHGTSYKVPLSVGRYGPPGGVASQ